MDAFESLRELSSLTGYEVGEEKDCHVLPIHRRSVDEINISHAVMPNGRRISLLKTLLTSACERDCNYCPFRAGREFRRETLKPVEMARIFMAIYRAGVVEGIFLSSGIAGGGSRIQDLLVDTAEILRTKYQFRGYIHLKVMPGAEFDQVRQAMRLANRVSLNLEAPNANRLERLAPHKRFVEELLTPLKWVEQIRKNEAPQNSCRRSWPSVTTQFVVGAAGESDLELLQTTEKLNREIHLNRAYYSAFNPVRDTPLENQPPASPVRERRLYQASFLLRDYGFDLEELPFGDGGDLPLQIDPKSAWANANLAESELEINKADRLELLRLPGIGPRSVQVILATRRRGKIRSFSELKALGIRTDRLSPYVLLDGKKPDRQLSLWEVGAHQ